MKKLLLSLLIPVMFACGTEDSDSTASLAQTPTETIKGTWDAKTRKIEYYNSSGTKLHEDNEVFGPGKFSFDGSRMTVYTSSGAVQETQFYKIGTAGGKTTLSTSRNGTVYTDMELSRLTQSNMTWVIEKSEEVDYTENGVSKRAQKSKQTYELTR